MRILIKLKRWIERQITLHMDFKWFRRKGFTRKAAWFNANNTYNSPTRRS